MKKTILALLGSALIAATAVQTASAAERHRVHRATTAPAPVSERVRNANDSWQPLQAGTDWSRYQNGAYSAPAGR
jgi:hypothetical protein